MGGQGGKEGGRQGDEGGRGEARRPRQERIGPSLPPSHIYIYIYIYERAFLRTDVCYAHRAIVYGSAISESYSR